MAEISTSTHSIEEAFGLARWIARDGIWCVDQGNIQPGGISNISGWYIRPMGLSNIDVFIEGTSPTTFQNTRDINLERLFQLPHDMNAMRFSSDFTTGTAGNEIRLKLGLNGRSINHLRDQFYPLFSVPLPEPHRRQRVHGSDDPFAFELEGYSAFRKLKMVAESATGKTFDQIGLVLDWGCGCGRTARYMKRTGVEIYGADIDHDNIRWCQQNIGPNFSAVQPQPPLPYPSSQFDLIYGISVFSHLNQQHETLWLKELRRVARPGAVVLMSILGGVAALRGGLLYRLLERSPNEGFLDVGGNADLGNFVNQDYYRNVVHLPGHIYSEWGKHFEIVQIIDGIIGNNQDLVVMRVLS